MPRVGRDRFDLPALGVKSKGKEILVGHPEPVIETLLEFFGFLEHAPREIAISHEPKQLGHPHFCHVNESLFFAGRNWRTHIAPILINDGVAGILPGLILIALLTARFVIVEAIPEQVRVLVFPPQSAQRGLQQRPNQILVPGPVPQLRQHHRIER